MRSFAFILASFVAAIVAGGMATPQDLEQDIAPVEKEFKEVKAGDRFHTNVIKAAKQQWRSGKITWRKYRKIRAYMIMPGFRQQVEDMAVMQLKTTNVGGEEAIELIDFSNIDWDSLIAFIEKLIPLILKLIDALAVHELLMPGSPVGAFMYQKQMA